MDHALGAAVSCAVLSVLAAAVSWINARRCERAVNQMERRYQMMKSSIFGKAYGLDVDHGETQSGRFKTDLSNISEIHRGK